MATYSEAVQETIILGLTTEDILLTVEIYNPIVGSVYMANNPEDVTAILEDSTEVTFRATNFTATRPIEDSESVPEFTLNLDAIPLDMVDYWVACIASGEDTELRIREYRASDLSAPTTTNPWSYIINDIPITDTQAQIKAAFADLKNQSFPNHLFTRTKFPGL
jgi:hypothetical protein